MSDMTSVSLLERLKTKEDSEDAWRLFVQVYEPFISKWLVRRGVPPEDADDIRQEVMSQLLAKLPEFDHNGRPGAFRYWLKEITRNCAKAFWRRENRAPDAIGGSDCLQFTDQLADPHSGLSSVWDSEHNAHVLGYLLRMIQEKFEANTLQGRLFEALALTQSLLAQSV